MAQLPPPDPNESPGSEPAGDLALIAPTAIHLAGPPSVAADRLADAILSSRPGALVVVVAG
jgi:hypothetical protein